MSKDCANVQWAVHESGTFAGHAPLGQAAIHPQRGRGSQQEPQVKQTQPALGQIARCKGARRVPGPMFAAAQPVADQSPRRAVRERQQANHNARRRDNQRPRRPRHKERAVRRRPGRGLVLFRRAPPQRRRSRRRSKWRGRDTGCSARILREWEIEVSTSLPPRRWALGTSVPSLQYPTRRLPEEVVGSEARSRERSRAIERREEGRGRPLHQPATKRGRAA